MNAGGDADLSEDITEKKCAKIVLTAETVAYIEKLLNRVAIKSTGNRGSVVLHLVNGKLAYTDCVINEDVRELAAD